MLASRLFLSTSSSVVARRSGTRRGLTVAALAETKRVTRYTSSPTAASQLWTKGFFAVGGATLLVAALTEKNKTYLDARVPSSGDVISTGTPIKEVRRKTRHEQRIVWSVV